MLSQGAVIEFTSLLKIMMRQSNHLSSPPVQSLVPSRPRLSHVAQWFRAGLFDSDGRRLLRANGRASVKFGRGLSRSLWVKGIFLLFKLNLALQLIFITFTVFRFSESNNCLLHFL